MSIRGSSRVNRLVRARAMMLIGIAASSSPAWPATLTITNVLNFPVAVAVDSGGNVFVADYSNGAIYRFLVAENFATIHNVPISYDPDGVALDASGNLFVANYNTYVYKYPAPDYTAIQILGSGFNQPGGLVVDSSGNVFVADYGNNAVKEILAPAYTTVKTLGSGFNQPAGVALDSSNNVIVADRSNNAVKKILAPDYTTVTTIGSGFSSPWAVAVDSRNNVFVADTFNGAIKEVVAPAYTEIVAFYGAPGQGFNQPRGVAVDANGNVFVADTYTHSLKEILAPVLPPTIATAFGASTIATSGTTSLTFTISYKNAGASPGIAFSDNLPAGLAVATPSGLTNSCGGTATADAGSSSVSLSGASVTGSAVCTVVVNVQGTTSGVKNNSVQVSSTSAGAGNTSNASLTVVTPLPPSIAKAFGASTVALYGTTSLTFTVTNPNADLLLQSIAFTDSMPAGLVVASPNTPFTNSCGGTATATAGSSSVSLSGASLAASGSCTVSVQVQGVTGGDKNNSVQVTFANGVGNTSNATLSVPFSPTTIAKAFGASTIGMFATTSLTFTITNPNAGAAQTGVAFTDSLPAGLVVATPNALTNSCGGTATAVAGATSASLSGGNVAASGSCTVKLDVQGTTGGVKNNSVQVSSTNGGVGNTSNASLTVPFLPPTIFEAFAAPTISTNRTTALTFTVGNPNADAPETGLAFSDGLPVGLVIATPNGLTNTCGGAVTAVAGSSSVSLTGGTAAGNGSCAVSIVVLGAAPGIKANSVQVTADNGGTGNTSDAMLTVATCKHDDTLACGGFEPATQYTLRTGFNDPSGVAVDSGGNVFVADFNHDEVKVILAPGYTTVDTIGSGLLGPGGVAVDGAGNVFVADYWHSLVKKMLPPAYTTINPLGSGFANPQGVAVDANGNVFVADTGTSSVKEILAPGYTTVNTLGSGFYHPTSVAVDADGNVFVADAGNNAVKEILAPGFTTVNTLGSGFLSPGGVAVDANGNVFVADSGNNAVKEIMAPGYTTIATLGSGFNFPQGVAVDVFGNVFVADSGSNSVKQILDPWWPPFN